MKPRAYSYVRFSSAEQGKGRSEARQLEDCVRYCKLNGLELATGEEYTFLDRGKSAYKGDHIGENGQLARFLKLVRNGSICTGSYLIVESLDRLSRDLVKLALPRFLDLLNAGINVVTLTDGKVYTSDCSDSDLIISIFVMARAHEESHTKSKRLGDVWRKKQESARTDKKPMGKAAPLWLDYIDGKYALNDHRTSIIRRIFQMTIDGYGKAVVARTLNQEAIPSFKGKTWGSSSIQKILKNRAVLGEYQPHSGSGVTRQAVGTPILNFYPWAIEESIFYQALSATNARYLSGVTNTAKHFNLWQGLTECAFCSTPLHLVSKGSSPKGGKYLQCYKARKGLCRAKAVRLDNADEVFKELLSKVDSLALIRDSSDFIRRELNATEAHLADERSKIAAYRSALKIRPSSTIHELLMEAEDQIGTLEQTQETLKTTLETEQITNKEDFFSKLDLSSYEGRNRANSLLKRLKIKVRVDSVPSFSLYIVIQKAAPIILFFRTLHDVLTIPITSEQLEKMQTQGYAKDMIRLAEAMQKVFKRDLGALLRQSVLDPENPSNRRRWGILKTNPRRSNVKNPSHTINFMSIVK